MFSPPNKNKCVPRASWVSYALVVLIAVVLARCSSEKGGHPSVPRAEVPVNPLEEMLRPRAPVTYRDGIAALILLDTSGSMADKVEGAGKKLEAKIDIARRAVIDLVRRFEAFAAEHRERPILVGVLEFSSRERRPSSRSAVPLGAPDLLKAQKALATLKAQGGTPIGDAMLAAKRDLDATGLLRRHILVVTDGMNTSGYAPGDVADAISRQREQDRASIYFVAFDIEAKRFDPVRNAGGLVLSAAKGPDLEQALDYLLTGKILVEQPTTATR